VNIKFGKQRTDYISRNTIFNLIQSCIQTANYRFADGFYQTNTDSVCKVMFPLHSLSMVFKLQRLYSVHGRINMDEGERIWI